MSKDENSNNSVFRIIVQKWENQSIQTKLITLLIIFILLPVLGTASYSFGVQRPQLLLDAQQDISIKASDISDKIGQKVNDSIETLLILSSSKELREYIQSNNSTDKARINEEINDIFKTVALHTSGIAQIRYLDENGQEISRVDTESSFVFSGNNNPSEVTITRGNDLQDKSGRGYFIDTKVLDNGQVYISNLDLNREGGVIQLDKNKQVVPVLRYATPLYNGSTFKGIVILNYYFQSVFDDILKVFGGIYENEEISIIQDSGEILFNSEELRWTSSVNNEDGTDYSIFDDNTLPKQLVKGTGDSILVNSIIYTTDRVNIDFSNSDFVLFTLVKVPYQSIVGEINLQIIISTLATIIVGILSIFIAYLTIRKVITNPIKDVVLQAEKIAEGDLRGHQEVSITRTDEIGILEGQFLTMQVNLNDFVKNIKIEIQTFSDYMEQLYLASEEVRSINRDTSNSFKEIAIGVNNQAEQNSEVSHMINDYTGLVTSVVDSMEETVELIKEINEEVTFIALNAQIEAARVGAVGRGFMIVASSIRDLSKNTKQQLKSMQNNMKRIKESVDTSVDNINTNVEALSSGAEEIAAISTESEDKLDTQSAIFIEMANTIQRLNKMSNELLKTTEVFTINDK